MRAQGSASTWDGRDEDGVVEREAEALERGGRDGLVRVGRVAE